ncbi:hypothetical protein OIE69_43500 (plasmid) [Actinacidiphila glaucinigra]|nr:hypothetical protein [Actinacidiphila glaucinigra]WSD65775.1 hypothetical protein OIE69_43500 [Actinacidiphila glaucinigra]
MWGLINIQQATKRMVANSYPQQLRPDLEFSAGSEVESTLARFGHRT